MLFQLRSGQRRSLVCPDNTVRDNHIHGNEITGVEIQGAGPSASASRNVIKNNDLHGNFAGGQLKAESNGTCSDNSIEDNRIHDNVVVGFALLTVDAPPVVSQATVTGNMVRGNDIFTNGSAAGDGGLTLSALSIGANGGNTTSIANNTVENNHIHENAPHGLWLVAGINDGGSARTSNNRILNNTIEANDGWGVQILGALGGLPPIFEDDTVVDNVFQGNTFAGNGLGQINGANNATAVQSATWGLSKSHQK